MSVDEEVNAACRLGFMVGVIIGSVFAFLGGLSLGAHQHARRDDRQAIKADYAHYHPKTGDGGVGQV